MSGNYLDLDDGRKEKSDAFRNVIMVITALVIICVILACVIKLLSDQQNGNINTNGNINMNGNGQGNVVENTENDPGSVNIDNNTNASDQNGSPIVETPTVQPTPKVEKPAKTKIVVALDPGHGGDYPGAMNKSLAGGPYKEKDLNLQIAMKAMDEIYRRGSVRNQLNPGALPIEVYLIRSTDSTIEHTERVEQAVTEANADLFISIHMNSHDDKSVHGLEVWYNNNTERESWAKCRLLAKNLLDEILEETNAHSRGLKDGGENTTAHLAVLCNPDHMDLPCVLIECGFISNDEECLKLSSEEYQWHIANGIASAVDCYLEDIGY